MKRSRLMWALSCLLLLLPGLLSAQTVVRPEFIGNSTAQVGGTAPNTIMTETDESADGRRWQWKLDGGILKGLITKDNGTSPASWIEITRSGYSVSSVKLPSPLWMGAPINFSSTVGNSGFGIRSNAGTMEFKNTAGSWQPFSANVATQGGGWTHSTGLVSLDTGTDRVQAGNINNIRYASVFDGADAGAKMTAAKADLPSTGGVIDARSFEGEQTIASPVTLDKNVTIMLGNATFTCATTCFSLTNSGSSVIGLGYNHTILKTSSGTADVVQISTNFTSLKSLSIQSAVVRTAGAGINCKSGCNFFGEKLEINPTYDGIKEVEGSSSMTLMSVYLRTGSSSAGNWHAAMILGGDYPAGGTAADLRFYDLRIGMDKVFSSGAALILDSGLDTVAFDGLDIAPDTFCQANDCGSSMIIRGTSSTGFDPPRWVRFSNSSFENSTTSTTATVVINSAKDVRFVNSYFSGGLVNLDVNATGTIRSVEIDNSVIEQSSQEDIKIRGTAANLLDFSVVNSTICGASQAGAGSYAAVSVAASFSSWAFRGNNFDALCNFTYSTKPSYYITVGAGAGGFDISHNYMPSGGRATGDISDSSSSSALKTIGPNMSASQSMSILGQYSSKVATGTAPFSAVSTTPTNIEASPTTYNINGLQLPGNHMVVGVGTANGAGLLSVTFAGSSVFTAAFSYVCTANNETGVFAVTPTRVSASSATFQTRANADSIAYSCVGY